MFIKDIIRRIRISILRFKAKSLRDLKPKGRVLIIAPHPDDEVIGCAGLIQTLVDVGNPPYVIILTGGEGSLRAHSSISESEVKAARTQLTDKAAGILGLPLDHIHRLDFTDGHVSDEIGSEKHQALLRLVSDIAPDSIFIPHHSEGWPDHIAVRELLSEVQSSKFKVQTDLEEVISTNENSENIESVIPTSKKHKIREEVIVNTHSQIYEYCVWMWYYNVWNLDWPNGYRLKMDKSMHLAKLAAVKAYTSPVSPCGKPWSGVLPKTFLYGNLSNIELYFLIR